MSELRTSVKDLIFRAVTAAHRSLFDVSKGRLAGRMAGMPVARLVTVGRRSGQERSTMLTVPIADGGRIVLVASFGGDSRDPAWYRNLTANPRVRITMAGSTRTMLARTADQAERAELWPRVTATFHGYAAYQRKTDRPIPLVVLEPA